MQFFNLIELKLTNHLNLKIGGFFSRPKSRVGRHQKTRYVAINLKTRRKNKPKLTFEQYNYNNKSNHHISRINPYKKEITHQQHHLILTKQDTYHRWRYKKVWATKEERNTTFFQRSILKRTRRNKIINLINLDGSMSTTPQKLEATLNDYFKSIFTSQCSSTTNPKHCNKLT